MKQNGRARLRLGQRLLLGALVLAASLGGAHLAFRRAQPSVRPVRGYLAPLSRTAAPETVAVVHPDQLGRGRVVGLADDGSEAFLLHHQGWSAAGPRGVRGPFGAGSRAGEGRINSAVAIALHDSAVYVLDRVPASVLVFTNAGEFRRRLYVRAPGPPAAFSPEHLAVHGARLLVSGFRIDDRGNGTRLILRGTAGGSFERVAAFASSLFDTVLPVAARAGAVYAVEATYRFIEVDAGGTSVRRFARTRAPRVPLPDSVRRSLARLAGRLPPGARSEKAPDYLPPAVAAVATDDRSFIVALMSALDSVLIEELDAHGIPRRTLTQPLPLPVALTASSVLTLHEEANTTIVERWHWVAAQR